LPLPQPKSAEAAVATPKPTTRRINISAFWNFR